MSYYMVQYSDFAANAAHITHYATWTRGGSVTWSTTAPTTAPDNVTTFAIGLTTNASAPGEIRILGEDGKTIPPPSGTFAVSVADLNDFKSAFDDYTASRG